MSKYKFTWQKEEDVNDYKAWAECMNFHVDEIISENPKALFWATIRCIKDIYQITCITLYDKVNKVAYTCFSENDRTVGSDDCHAFEHWCFRQFDRLCDKLGYKPETLEFVE